VSLIEDYAMIGDLQTAALVSRNGSIDWLCLPAFDSAACFAALLGGEDAGFWRIAPQDAGDCTERSYRTDTLILESLWHTDDGTVRLIVGVPQRLQDQGVRAVEPFGAVACVLGRDPPEPGVLAAEQIGRASCRERV